ncbi:MAG TPA: HAD family hydrolase [Candidatus Blautia intestinigallinarum]|nr:HAD family hydrolase [Candidatus Blautia intestinigallinarum]
MRRIILNGKSYDIRLFVFDKDGLMFQSKPFWIALAQSRIDAMTKEYPDIAKIFAEKWMQFVGAKCEWEDGTLKVKDMDPMGIFAVASVPEETTAAAAFFAEHLNMNWIEARKVAENIFDFSDAFFRLDQALIPRKGFPDILQRLNKAGIPYGIATSDTKERVRQSLEIFDDYSKVKFVVTIEDVEKGKPSPDMLQWIQAFTQIPMENIAMVGDSLVDVQMAKYAGAIGIGIPEHEEMRNKMMGVADEIIEDLDCITIREGR